MKYFLGIVTLSFLIALSSAIGTVSQMDQGNQQGSQQRSLEVTQAKPNLPPKEDNSKETEDRKLFPFLNPFMYGYGLGMNPQQMAGSMGSPVSGQPGAAGQAAMGPNINSMVAGTQMVGNAMMNPMINPFSPANPFSPMSPGNPFNPLNPLNQPRRSKYVLSVDDDVLQDASLASPVDLAMDVYDDQQGFKVVNLCGNVKQQALEIANRLMKKQNNKIFKELVSYLVKAKFLIGMTEIKLTRALRKRVFGLMTAFSSLEHQHFNFVDPESEDAYVPDEDIHKFKSIYPSPEQLDKKDIEEDLNTYKPLGKKKQKV